jgi:hypothetical protein
VKTLRSEILIDAPPDVVWAVIVDFERYGEWNPFVVDIRGTAVVGTRLRVTMSPPGGRGVTLNPRVTEVDEAAVLEWFGHLAWRGIFDGRHRFELHRTETGTRLVQHEVFSGALVRLFAGSLDRRTLAGFHAMNAALKARSELAASAGEPRADGCRPVGSSGLSGDTGARRQVPRDAARSHNASMPNVLVRDLPEPVHEEPSDGRTQPGSRCSST